MLTHRDFWLGGAALAGGGVALGVALGRTGSEPHPAPLEVSALSAEAQARSRRLIVASIPAGV
jgi:hypothetical protein